MAVVLEPPRARPRPADGDRYPGLTLEERGIDAVPVAPPRVDFDPPPPLWIAPSEIPSDARSAGFASAYPETILPDPPRREGLFDVPGLLERLWLARALEAARERDTPTPPVVTATVEPVTPVLTWGGAATRYGVSAPVLQSSPPEEPRPSSRPVPKGWICSRCYLTNDAESTACRGCQRAGPGP